MIRPNKLSLASAKLMFAFATLTAGAGFISFDAHAALPGHPEKANGKPSPQVTNPYSPRYQHEYRHGAIPTIGTAQAMKQWAHAHMTAPTATNLKTLSYGGGVGGVGVMTGQSKVYLVFYGNQWGTSSTDANGNLKFTNDTAGAAGAAQQMFKGIGTNGETWQNDLTQWCNATTGATSCAAGIPRTPRQSNILAGVWYDNGIASPAAATGTQLAQEAIRAAAHFGNTASGSNVNSYYVILSPKGTNPDTYQGRYCAWHDYTGDGYGVTAPGGDFAFSNQPYNLDSGTGCGVNFVNSGAAGTLDGYTMTLGHEWQETMSDWFPAGGWTNHDTGGTYAGQENSDECAWIAAGTTGGAANITFSTGTFAEQASWSNDTNSCAISHADVSGGGGGGGGGTVLSNGVAKTGISGAAGSDQFFTLAVPAGATNLKFVTSGGTGDADLYVKFGSNPSTTVNDCKSEGGTTAETCSIATAQAGTYYVLIHGYATFSGVSLTGSYSTGTGGGCTPSGTTLCSGSSVALPSVATGGVSSTYSLVVPAGKTSVTFSISGGTGDADLYVKQGSAPTSTSYTCRPYLTGNSETCTISSPVAGTYYANVRAYAAYSGVTLSATISP